jgi:hypothetical protein
MADFGSVGKEGAAGFISGDKPTVGAGSSGTGSIYSSDIWQFNSSSGTWDSVASFGGGVRYYAVAFGVNGKGYMGTGINGSPLPLNDWWEFQAPVSVSEINEKENLTVFPNPSSEKITLTFEPGNTPIEIEIMDLSGRLKKEFSMLNSSTTISVTDLESGIYILKAMTEKKILHRKISISK